MTEAQRRERIVIGIPSFSGACPEVLQDYMRFAFFCGRHMQEYDFAIAVKGRSEQFRARNSIVNASFQWNADWLFMLDDDHILDTKNDFHESYSILKKLLSHKKMICGALYWQRGGNVHPVIMHKFQDQTFGFFKRNEILGELQEVDVTGGGCVLINMKLFEKMKEPYFGPEFQYGTDLQLALNAQAQGVQVYCDTSIEVGHMVNEATVITSENAASHPVYEENVHYSPVESALTLLQADMMEYLDVDVSGRKALEDLYNAKIQRFHEYKDPRDYYANLGKEQVAKQLFLQTFYKRSPLLQLILTRANTALHGEVLDYGCGTGWVGFELALRGQTVTFVDIPGNGGIEFVKWRAKKHEIEERCHFFSDEAFLGAPLLVDCFDYILMLDVIEHIPFEDCPTILKRVARSLKPGGVLVNNFDLMKDYDNPEHINLNKRGVKEILIENKVFPFGPMFFVKDYSEEGTI